MVPPVRGPNNTPVFLVPPHPPKRLLHLCVLKSLQPPSYPGPIFAPAIINKGGVLTPVKKSPLRPCARGPQLFTRAYKAPWTILPRDPVISKSLSPPGPKIALHITRLEMSPEEDPTHGDPPFPPCVPPRLEPVQFKNVLVNRWFSSHQVIRLLDLCRSLMVNRG